MGWSTLCKSAGDTEVGAAVGVLDGCAGVQRDITKRNLPMARSAGSCSVWPVVVDNPVHQSAPGANRLESSSAGRTWNCGQTPSGT